jgi:hypothetical protein
MFLDGQPIRAGVLVDLVVDAAHRSLGPALILQREILERALAEFDFVYGFPNPKAVRVVTRVGYSVIDESVRCSLVLHHAPYLERVLPRPLARAAGAIVDGIDRGVEALRGLVGTRLSAEWRDDVDPRMQALWERSAPQGLVGSKDIQGLGWRFAASSDQRARYLLVGARAEGPLEAWFACQARGSTLHVRDFWSVEANTSTPRAAIRALARAARSAGFSSVSVECTASSRALASWLRAGFRERGRRPVVGAWNPALNLANSGVPIHLTAADEDE